LAAWTDSRPQCLESTFISPTWKRDCDCTIGSNHRLQTMFPRETFDAQDLQRLTIVASVTVLRQGTCANRLILFGGMDALRLVQKLL
jgi:hypothetical protein